MSDQNVTEVQNQLVTRADFAHAVHGALVTLGRDEWEWAIHVGMRRTLRAREARRVQVYGVAPIDADVEGACAECAFAKYLGVYWEARTDPDRTVGDVGGWQVRSTVRDDGHLLLHREDADAGRYVLVTGRAPRLTVRGAIVARAGKRAEWWRQPRVDKSACFYVPQAALEPVDPTIEAWRVLHAALEAAS